MNNTQQRLFLKAFEELFKEFPNNKFPVGNDDGRIFIEIPIGSKTGTGKLYMDEGYGSDEGYYTLVTRYDQKNTIYEVENLIEDLSSIAFDWYLNYIHKGYGPSSDWIGRWEKEGRIKKKITESWEPV